MENMAARPAWCGEKLHGIGSRGRGAVCTFDPVVRPRQR